MRGSVHLVELFVHLITVLEKATFRDNTSVAQGSVPNAVSNLIFFYLEKLFQSSIQM